MSCISSSSLVLRTLKNDKSSVTAISSTRIPRWREPDGRSSNILLPVRHIVHVQIAEESKISYSWVGVDKARIGTTFLSWCGDLDSIVFNVLCVGVGVGVGVCVFAHMRGWCMVPPSGRNLQNHFQSVELDLSFMLQVEFGKLVNLEWSYRQKHIWGIFLQIFSSPSIFSLCDSVNLSLTHPWLHGWGSLTDTNLTRCRWGTHFLIFSTLRIEKNFVLKCVLWGELVDLIWSVIVCVYVCLCVNSAQIDLHEVWLCVCVYWA